MSEEVITEPEDTSEEWVDVRMTDPEEGEWDVDFVVIDGSVQYVDLRVKPELVTAFVDCLIDDVDAETAGAILAKVADRQDVDIEE